MFIKRLKNTSSHVNNEVRFKLIIADSFLSRFIGLMFKHNMAFDQALLLTHCNWIHTCFIHFDLDLIFLNKEFSVIKIRHLKPFRFSLPVRGGSHVLELKAGCARYHKINIGDRFIIEGTADW